jgi:hypothetical protein
MAMVNWRDLGAAREEGRFHACSLRKVPSQASVAGHWVDLSMAAGNPKPNYYASSPLVAATLDGFGGIFHGDAKSPSAKYLTELMLCTSTAGLVGAYKLLDYLLYYPFVDFDDADPQVFDNAVTLPRYADGEGVRAMLIAAAPTTGGGTFSFDYINQDGVARTSPVQNCSTAALSIASCVTGEQGTAAGGQVFLRLAEGDTGIRSVTGFSMGTLNGGLGTLVLVKPLLDTMIYEINTPSEKSIQLHAEGLPKIEDGAYLNLIMNCAATVAAGVLVGRADFAWSTE